MLQNITKDTKIRSRLTSLGVNSHDVQETFVRSSGPGGQNVNKVSTCVHLQHIPTGIIVKYQKFKLQSLNREQAWHRLLDKIQELRKQKEISKAQDAYRLSCQKRKRPLFLKIKILETKRFQSQKKKDRKSIRIPGLDAQ